MLAKTNLTNTSFDLWVSPCQQGFAKTIYCIKTWGFFVCYFSGLGLNRTVDICVFNFSVQDWDLLTFRCQMIQSFLEFSMVYKEEKKENILHTQGRKWHDCQAVIGTLGKWMKQRLIRPVSFCVLVRAKIINFCTNGWHQAWSDLILQNYCPAVVTANYPVQGCSVNHNQEF